MPASVLFMIRADSLRELLDAGNAAYDRGEYETALENYTQILTEDMADGAVYYNAGNAQYIGNFMGIRHH